MATTPFWFILGTSGLRQQTERNGERLLPGANFFGNFATAGGIMEEVEQAAGSTDGEAGGDGTSGRPAPPSPARSGGVVGLLQRDLLGVSAFEEPSLEYRRLFGEMFGTFLLVLVAAGAGVVGALPGGGDITLPMKVTAPGLMVMGIIYFMGTVSGAHLNPVVTWSFAVRRNFPWSRVPGYVLAQLIGGVVAALVLQWLFGGVAHGATVVGAGVDPWVAAVTEGLLTLGLVSVILGTAFGARNVGANSAIAVGFYIALAGMWAAPVSGASMNTTRSFATALVAGDFADFWVYVVGPLAGGSLAVLFEYILRGSASEAGRLAATGVLSPDNPAGR